MWVMSVTSAIWAVPSKPEARMPSKTSFRPSALTSTPTTFAPPAAHFSEISLPKPLAAPVTMMTLLFRYFTYFAISFLSARSIRLNDGLKLVGRRAVHDHGVGAVVEFLANALHALRGRPGGRRFQPFVGNQRGDVFDLLMRGLVVDPACNRRHYGVFPKALQHGWIPAIRLHH